MDIFNNPRIKETVQKWCELTKERVLGNLKQRSVIAQLPLISGVDFEIRVHQDTLQINFSFERKPTIVVVSKEGGKNFLKSVKLGILVPLSVVDPLTDTTKPFLGKDRGTSKLGFLRKADVYERIKTTYADELTSNIIEEIPEIAGKILITGL